MKKIAILMSVGGSGLAAFGLSAFDASIRKFGETLDGGAGWDLGSRIEITVGVVLFTLGVFLYKESRSNL